MTKSNNRYQKIIEKIFFDRYEKSKNELLFKRTDLEKAASDLEIQLPKNIGDVIYSIRYRTEMPTNVLATQPEGMEWIIEGAGRSKYMIKLVKINRIVPNIDLITIKIPDSTPEIVSQYALSDEQALLAKVRYNRLVDIFLGLTTYSLQNHLRTTVKDVGQIEIDEIYVGIDQSGNHFVIPVQAKGGNDQLSVVQSRQDILCCSEKFPDLTVRTISAQFMDDDLIAMFELTIQDDQIRLVNEKHYRLVSSSEITIDDIKQYRTLSSRNI
jgi:hypothetical protein